MKIAIPISIGISDIAESGGAFTFEAMLVRALLAMDSELRYEFWLYDISLQNQHLDLLKYSSLKNIQIWVPSISTLEKGLLTLWGYILAIMRLIQRPKVRPYRERWTALWFCREMGKSKPDLVWSLTPNCPYVKSPYVITIWDLQHRLQPFFPEVSSDKEWLTREYFFRRIIQPASYIITGTPRGQAEIERFYQVASERIRILAFPSPTISKDEINTETVVRKYKVPEDYLFYPAQFWPHKNHVGILSAVNRLREQYNIEISVVFTGADKGNLSHVKAITQQYQLTSKVHFLGFVPQADLSALYRQAFALIFMSFFGPDNLPPLEAFAYGCPVIAADVPGAREQLGDAALRVPLGKDEAIAEAIKSLKEHPELRQQLIERGQYRAAQWTGQDYVRGMLDIVDEFATVRRCWL